MKIKPVLTIDPDDDDDTHNARRLREVFSRAFNFMPEYEGSLLGPLSTPGQFITREHLARASNAASFAITEIMEREGRGVLPADEREGLLGALAECRTWLNRLVEILRTAERNPVFREDI